MRNDPVEQDPPAPAPALPDSPARTPAAGRVPGRALAILAMIGSAACWGSATVMSRDLLYAIPPVTLLVVQLTASVAFLVVLSAPHVFWRYRSRRFARAASIGLLEPGATYTIGLVGLALTTAGSASVIGASEPVLIPLVAFLIFGHRPSRRLVACIAVATLGLVLVSSASAALPGASPLGDLLIVLATLTAATYVVLSARIAGDYPTATLASGQQAVGLAFGLGAFALVAATRLDETGLDALTPGILAYAALSGVVQYALAFWLYLIGLRRFSAGAAGLWLTLIPVFGLLGAWLWLGEVPTLMTLVGAAMIVAAVTLGRGEE
ncbi:DMT family transporter [Salinarimonas ramus]|uniref:EamA domain-containing protein n=1 Tax=Salinarimonas ramus TaxID=690164 RepID=A0A917QCL0_9HYPH|nr:DMT family transporter [Salinarimonas ramus]GGK43538.1 hypothetical protein GCM10011322_33320 [Salinarimonas ramus]